MGRKKDIRSLAESVEMDEEEFREMGRSADPAERMFVYEMVAGYWGWDNLDNYPEKFTVEELEKRWEL